MNGEAGAFVMVDGVLQPDLSDEAMAGRQPQDVPAPKNKKVQPEVTPVEVPNA